MRTSAIHALRSVAVATVALLTAVTAAAAQSTGTSTRVRSAASAPTDTVRRCPITDDACRPPNVAREFRAVWVATVDNIDWPSKKNLSTAEQQAELTTLLDKAAAIGLNAVVFQVRPAGDALYASDIEPWSEYLTGLQGKAPSPFWDPLAFAVKEAHARGMELHAWFNPYRAKHPSAQGPLAKNSLARTNPDLVKSYGTHLWMDPGEPAVRARTLKVVLDVVKRYDIDGVHLDDYFYPYKEKRANGSTEFPDDASWKKYQKSGGELERDDWRRSNVDQLILALHTGIAREKPWVKFGISPFGIWRPGNPETVVGFDAYTQLYADSRKWLREGWVDYFTPQLYWAIDKQGQRFPELLKWWVEQNVQGRHMWPGLYTSKVGEGGTNAWRRDEILNQVRATRAQTGAAGDVHFSMKVFLENRDSVATALERIAYDAPALVPASPWMGDAIPAPPKVAVKRTGVTWESLVITPGGKAPVRWWVIQASTPAGWVSRIVDGTVKTYELADIIQAPVPLDLIAVTAIDRVGVASAPVVLQFP
jgi:uncharacterized lipoprotein YddW (UPF0748 family)